ncbi:MAG: type VI secretion system tube protein Hcp [Steroidobacteraceae bacterium]
MRIITAVAAAAVLAVVSAPSFAESVASVPSDFELIGKPTGASAQGMPDVYFNLSLNPLPLLSAPLEGTVLSLANATNPVYHYPGSTGNVELDEFSFGLGESLDEGSQSTNSGKGGKVTLSSISITKKTDSASATLYVDVLGVPGLESQYAVSLLFTGLDPSSLAMSTTPPITPCSPPGCAFEDFVFTLPAPTDDPDVAFSVISGSTTYSFSAVPEPPVWALLALALVLLGCRPREKSRFIP